MPTQSLRLARQRRLPRLRWPRLSWRAWLLPLLLCAVLELVVRVGWLPEHQMPAPSSVALTLWQLAQGELTRRRKSC